MIPERTSRTESLLKEKDYPRCRKYLPDVSFDAGRYTLRFAQDTNALDEILRLRFEVFNLELGEGLERSYRTHRDEDEFDAGCHHLMVAHKDSGKVVGTYRMQTREMAEQGSGFYALTEFDLSQLPAEVLDNAIELGRACIAKEHRNGRVLFLLWKGLATYVFSNRKRYFFGCCSLTSQDPVEGKRVMNYLEAHDLVHPDWRCNPQPGSACYDETMKVEGHDGVKIPRLMRLYLQYGAKIVGPPAIDRLFRTIDYLAVFDAETVDERTRKMFVT